MTARFPAPRARFVWRMGDQEVELGGGVWVVGILNCTPDSFSDGGVHLDASAVVGRLEQMIHEGADMIDVGGESTRPGALPVPAEEEWRRVAPVFRAARADGLRIPLSIDTRKSEVAARACELGAAVINDISALRHDPAMAETARSLGAGLVLMHMQGEPATMQAEPHYDDVVREVSDFLSGRLLAARAAGIELERIVVDPGIGFGKSAEHNWALLRGIPELAEACARPVYIGASRKRFLGAATGLPVHDRVEASIAVHVAAALAGAHLVRVHDVAATVRAMRVADDLRAGDR